MKLLLNQIHLTLGMFCLDIDLKLQGSIIGVFGPSGSGKTTLLEVVAGLRKPASALIQIDGQVLTDTKKGISVPTELRSIGYIPQDLALFPHLSVHKNLIFGFKSEMTHPTGLTFSQVSEVLEIKNLLERRIGSLSGGEKQRVAIARALMASPKILVMDEPLANLDRSLKDRIIQLLKRIRDEFQTPMLYVSHDPDEVVEICDEAIILKEGRCIQQGNPKNIFSVDSKPRYILAIE